MSESSARFFSYVQSAACYRELHQRAVELLPRGNGEAWFDVGCGPGLVTRLASKHGYQASGFDIDAAMLEQARHNAAQTATSSRYELLGIEELIASGRKAQVISAASLLIVLNEPQKMLRELLSCLEADGTLLIIETTAHMRPRAAWSWLMNNGWRERNGILLLWSWVRRHVRAVVPIPPPDYQIEQVNLFDNMVAAWLIRRTENR